MSEFRRVKIKGGTYFFTIVTFQRQKLFQLPVARDLFLDSVEHIRNFHLFKVLAFCILPDHIHFIWQLSQDDENYSSHISQIKRRFSRNYTKIFGIPIPKNESQIKRREVAIWQRRFWEHLIRDEDDLYQHIDYIHYNPVKHGLVDCVGDWECSSFHDYVREGIYDVMWGESNKLDEKSNNFGE